MLTRSTIVLCLRSVSAASVAAPLSGTARLSREFLGRYSAKNLAIIVSTNSAYAQTYSLAEAELITNLKCLQHMIAIAACGLGSDASIESIYPWIDSLAAGTLWPAEFVRLKFEAYTREIVARITDTGERDQVISKSTLVNQLLIPLELMRIGGPQAASSCEHPGCTGGPLMIICANSTRKRYRAKLTGMISSL
jgi:hypothetical protein